MKSGRLTSTVEAINCLGLTRLRGIYPGWWVVLTCSIIGVYVGGVYSYGFTLFFNPLREELGLTSTQTSLVFALTRLEGAFEGVLVGYLIDRFGARRVMMVGVPMAAIGFLAWAVLVNNYVMFILVYVGLVAFGINTGFFDPALAVANNWFVRKRAMAVSLIGVSLGVGGAILVPLLGFSIEVLGWRTTAALAGIAGLLVIWPLTLAVHHAPEQRGLLPDGIKSSGDGVGSPGPPGNDGADTAVPDDTGAVKEINFTVPEAFRTHVMYILLAAMTIRLFSHAAVTVHLAPLLIDRGMGIVAAGVAVGLLALLSIPSRLLAGSGTVAPSGRWSPCYSSSTWPPWGSSISLRPSGRYTCLSCSLLSALGRGWSIGRLSGTTTGGRASPPCGAQ